MSRTGDRVDVRAQSGPELLPRLIGELAAERIAVLAADVARPTLDDVFLGLTGRSLREGNSATDSITSNDREEIAA